MNEMIWAYEDWPETSPVIYRAPGYWSDGCVLFKSEAIGERTLAPGCCVKDLPRPAYRDLLSAAQCALPSCTPAVACASTPGPWMFGTGLALVPQIGRSLPFQYGFVSILRRRAPHLVLFIAPDYIIRKKHSPNGPGLGIIADPSGEVVGLMMPLARTSFRHQLGEVMTPTGWDPISDLAQVRATRRAAKIRNTIAIMEQRQEEARVGASQARIKMRKYMEQSTRAARSVARLRAGAA